MVLQSIPVVLNVTSAAAHKRLIYIFWRPTISFLNFYCLFHTFFEAKINLFDHSFMPLYLKELFFKDILYYLCMKLQF